MSKTTVSKLTINIISSTIAIAAFGILTGCQTLPNLSATSTANATINKASNPLTAQMSAIDRQGRIAYVKEQGVGTAKISTLYSVRPDGSDRQLIDQLNGYIYASAWSADGQMNAVPVSTGGYAASPQLSFDGQHMVYLSGRKAAVMTLATGQITNLAETGLDEPARLSPSGQYAVYPTRHSNLDGQVNGQNGGSLVIHSLSDNVSYAISSQAGGVVRSPVWGR